MSMNVDQDVRHEDWTKQSRDVDVPEDQERPFDKAQAEFKRKMRLARPARRDDGGKA